MNDSNAKPAQYRFGTGVEIDSPAYIDPTVRLYGHVVMGENCSLWPYAVIRSEALEVRVGRYVNFQDHTLVHIGSGSGTAIGDYCSITHNATVHGAILGENTLVGINATVMDGAVVGANCTIGAHCLVPEGARIPDNSVVVGVPAKVIRTRNNFVANRRNAMIYYWNALAYARDDHRGWEGPEYEAWHEGMMAEIQSAFREQYPDDVG